MRIRRIALSAAFAAGFAALPLAAPKAQYYYGPRYYPPPAYRPANPCWFPLFWPLCAAGAIVGTAAVVVTAPFRPPPYYYRWYGRRYYPAPAYAPGYYRRYYYGYGPR